MIFFIRLSKKSPRKKFEQKTVQKIIQKSSIKLFKNCPTNRPKQFLKILVNFINVTFEHTLHASSHGRYRTSPRTNAHSTTSHVFFFLFLLKSYLDWIHFFFINLKEKVCKLGWVQWNLSCFEPKFDYTRLSS